MAKSNTSELLVVAMVVVMVIANVGGAKAIVICKMDSAELALCLPAMGGPAPLPPSVRCCETIHKADLHCLCSYKAVLPTFGVNPALAVALFKKCDLNPPECEA